MELKIDNIGAISNADIELDGITVIAGINNKGKSTVGKILYALLHDMYDWEKTYQDIRADKIYSFLTEQSIILEDYCMANSGAKRRRTGKVNQLSRRYSVNEDFFAAIEDMQIQEGDSDLAEFLEKYAGEYFSLYFKKDEQILHNRYRSVIREWVGNTIQKASSVDIDELNLQKGILRDSFNKVFNKQYRRIGTDSSKLCYTEDNRKVSIKLGEEWEMDSPLRIRARTHFVESPRIYDILSDTRYGYVQREYLQHLMCPNTVVEKTTFRIQPSFDNEDAEDRSKRFAKILEQLTETVQGQADFHQKVGLEFKDERIAKPIHAANVSTGVKALALLEYAIRIGAIRENDILILDEPEINLHPEWQVIYARALVHLQKEFNIRILLTTHSPFFIRAIECYTDIENQMGRLNVYKAATDSNGDGVTFENLSYSEFGMTSLYDDLSAPLNDLEDLLEKETADDV